MRVPCDEESRLFDAADDELVIVVPVTVLPLDVVPVSPLPRLLEAADDDPMYELLPERVEKEVLPERVEKEKRTTSCFSEWGSAAVDLHYLRY